MIALTRLLALPLVLATLAVSAAQAQAPGQIPGTLPPAPAITPPPPPVAPPPVPSVVTPLPSPSYGVPPGVTGPAYRGGSVTPTVRYRQPPVKTRKIKRRPRSSESLFVRTI